MTNIPNFTLDVNNKYSRTCPKCQRILFYTNKCNRNTAEKKQLICRKCTAINISDKYLGHGNPFFGKHHTSKSINQMNTNIDRSKYKTSEFKEKMRTITTGNKNPMHGISVYSVWVHKYGEEIAKEKLIRLREKQSISSSGENNSMFGKPSPKGAGQGWKGWYKNDHFFRSLRELSYMIYLDENNISWSSAETNRFKVNYVDYNGVSKTTRPDFFINNDTVIEIKPKKLQKTPLVLLKRTAVEKFCKDNKLLYEMLDIEINLEKIKRLHSDGIIKFMKKYEQKILEYM